MKTTYNDWVSKVWNAKVPTYYKCLLIEASRRKCIQSIDGQFYYYNYSAAGDGLARHIENYVHWKKLDQLFKILNDYDGIKKWLKEHLNRFYSLVPSNRKDIFLRGFIACLEEKKGMYLLPNRKHYEE